MMKVEQSRSIYAHILIPEAPGPISKAVSINIIPYAMDFYIG